MGIKRLCTALAAAALVVSGLAVGAPPAEAAAKASVRVAGFSAPASVYSNQVFVLKGAAQRYVKGKWAAYSKPRVELYFDPSGSAREYRVKAWTAGTNGDVSTKAQTTRSGTWRVKVLSTGVSNQAFSVSKYVGIKARTSTAPSGWNCPSWAPIKGNRSSMIYHMPRGAFYTRTHPEICFSTESAAVQAGYRKSKR